jgi:hypothetical protein
MGEGQDAQSNLNLHFHEAHPCASPLRGSCRLCKSAILPIYHMLFLDGVYAEDNYGKTRFHQIKAPKKSELNVLAHRGLRVKSFILQFFNN